MSEHDDVFSDLLVAANSRVRHRETGQHGIALSPKVEDGCLRIWWGTSDNKRYEEMVSVLDLEIVENDKETSCVSPSVELGSGDPEANALEGRGELSDE